MLRRFLLVVVAPLLIAFLVISLGLWWFLSGWVPTRGKTLLIETIERQAPVRVAIGSLRYQLWRGAVLHEVTLTNRDSGELVLSAPQATIQVGWLTWVLRKQVLLSTTLQLAVPCRTTIKASGHYHTTSQSFMVDAYLEETDIRTITTPLAKRIPPFLKAGSIEADLRFTRPSHEPMTVRGRITGKNVVWETPQGTLTAGFILDGSAKAPFPQLKPWTYEAQVTLRDATLSNVIAIKTADALRGKLRITNEKIAIEELVGDILGSTWKTEGFLYLSPVPSLDVLIRSKAQVQPIVAAYPELAQSWQPEGAIEIRAVCRGLLKPAPFLDCLAHADIEEATLKSPRLPEPITQISGNLNVDFLTKQISLLFLEGHAKNGKVSAHGDIFLNQPLRLSLNLNGEAPLSWAQALLPSTFPAHELEGRAAFDVLLQGSPPQLAYRGRVDLNDARAVIPAWSKTIEALKGPILLDEHQIQLEQLTFQIDKQPFALTATVTPNRITQTQGTLTFNKGQCLVAARITPEEVLLDEAFLRLAHGTLRLQGRISKTATRPSTLSLKGALELDELKEIPFFPGQILEFWDPHGIVNVNLAAKGTLSDLPSANIGGVIRAEGLTIRSIPFEQLTCDVEQENRKLTLRIPSALAAGGRWSGNLSINHEAGAHAYRLETDIIALQLERLAKAIPAWQKQPITGLASGHLILAGQWEKRASWKGEGWLNAQGTQLGNIPLLEKFFQNGLLGPLATWLGLEPLRRAEITQASLRWTLADERIRSDDLRLVGVVADAAAVFYAKGSVGFDQTLDLTVEPQLSEQVVQQAQVIGGVGTVLKAAGALDRFLQLVRYHVTGTIKEPKAKFRFSPQELVRRMAETSPAGLLQNLFDQLTQ